MSTIAANPVYNGFEQIMSFYDTINNKGEYAYSVWYSRDICFQYPFRDNDAEAARKFFADNFLAMEQAGNKAMLWVKFHPLNFKGDIIDRNTKVISNTPVRATPIDEEEAINGTQIPAQQYFNLGGRGAQDGNNYRMFEAIEVLKNLPAVIDTAIEKKMQAYEDRLQQVESPQETPLLGQIMGIVDKNPGIVTEFFGFLRSLAPGPQAGPPQYQINGTNAPEAPQPEPGPQAPQQPEPGPETEGREIDNDVLDKALDRLADQGVILDTDLTHLANYAEKNPVLFAQILTVIRTQQ